MDLKHLLAILSTDGFLSTEVRQKIQHQQATKPFSLHWEYRILLYIGITLFAAGIGFLIYQNIDTIGHTIIILLTGLASASCFWFAYKRSKPFSKDLVKNDSPLPDYILLLACLLFLTFEGYLQFQYNIFGERYGLATLIPSILFSFIAYRFDHKGILSMAITGFAGWLGIAATPMDVFENDLSSLPLIFTTLLYGAALIGLSFASVQKKIKEHFSFTYLNFGANLVFISSLAGLMSQEGFMRIPFVLIIAAGIVLAIRYAKKEQSYYFMLITAIYGYIALTTLFFLFIEATGMNDFYEIFWLSCFYFIGSCGAIVFFFMNIKKLLKKS